MSSKNFKRIFIFSIIAGFFLALVIVGYSLLFSDKYQSTADDFLGKVANGQYDEAYTLGGARFENTTSEESWLDVSRKMNLRLTNAEINLFKRVDNGDSSFFTYTVASNNLTYDFLVHVSQEEGEYYIDYASYNVRTERSAQEANLEETEVNQE